MAGLLSKLKLLTDDFLSAPLLLKSTLLICCYTALVMGTKYALYIYEYVMNSGLFGPAATNLYDEGLIGYGLLASIGVCCYLWIREWLQLTKNLQSYQLDSITTLESR